MKEGPGEDIECVFESMGARGSIFISNYPAAQNAALLQAMNIKAVLSVARSGLLTHRKQDVPHYLYIPMEDHEEYDISKYFETTYDFIERGRRESNVLIHCMVGVSRSVTIVIAYLLRKYKYTLSQVISLLQRKRRKINPNPGFLQQLQKYSESLGIKCDFHDRKVPAVRDISTSKQVRAHSLKKERTPIYVPEPLTPIILTEKDREKTVLNPIICNEDLKSFGHRLQGIDLKRMKSSEEKGNNDIPNEELQPRRPFSNVNEKLQLKKSVSIEEGKQRKRSSIQQKISKIRQKILKTEHLQDCKPTLEAFPRPKPSAYLRKDDMFSREFSAKEDALSTRHLQLLTPVKLEERTSKRSRIEVGNQIEGVQIRNYLREEKNRELFSTDLKIQNKAFYSGHRQNPRFIRSKEEMAL